MASKSKIIAELFEADGDIIASALDNVVVSPTAVSDKPNTSTGGLTVPAGTTAQRPSSPDTGETRMNTTTGSLEFYDGSVWLSTNLIPTINSITGNVYSTLATNLVVSLANATSQVDIIFKEGSTLLATVSDVSISSGSATVAVPSAVYGQTAGDTITISVENSDGVPSTNTVNKTVGAIPTGGTVSATGTYKVHTFTSSGNFVVPTGFAMSMEYLVVAGGGSGGGRHGGGGGAGGMLTGSTSVSAATHSIVIGAGGAGGRSIVNSGANTTALSLTAIGGGYGGQYVSPGATGANGGSGGGGGSTSGSVSGGTGTSGQGNDGGDNVYNHGSEGDGRYTGGGGGKASAGGDGVSSAGGSGNGANGVQSNIDGNNYYYAAGGGGGWWSTTNTSRKAGSGGTGGGGGGGWSISTQANAPSGKVGTGGGSGRNSGGTPATNFPASADGGDAGANTGSGGGGNGQASWGSYDSSAVGSGSGGSGVVIIRYNTNAL